MSTEAKVGISGEGEQVLRTLKAIEKGFEKIAEAQTKNADASQKQAAEAKDLFDKMEAGAKKSVASILQMGAGFLSVQTGIKAMMAEYEKFQQKLAKSASATQEFGANIAAAAKNSPIQAGELENIAKRVAAKSGTTPQFVSQQMATIAAHGGGGLTGDKLESLLNTTVPVAAGNPEDFAAKASAVALYKAAGGDKANVSDKSLLGMFGLAAGGSLIDSEAQYSPIAANIMAAASANDLSESESLGAFNAITKATSDTTGLSSRTAGVKLMSAMGRAREGLGLKGSSSIRDIADALRRDEGARSKFLEDAAFETQNKDAMRQMFTPGTAESRLFDEAMANAPTVEQGEKAYDDLHRSLMSSSAVRNMMLGQGLKGAAENLALDPRLQQAGVVAEGMKEIRAMSSSTAMSDWFSEKSMDAMIASGKNPVEQSIDEVRGRIGSLRSQNAANVPHYMSDDVVNQQKETREREAQTLEAILETLEQMREMQKAAGERTAPPATNGDRPLVPMQPNPGAVR